jgi:hypothetical protein
MELMILGMDKKKLLALVLNFVQLVLFILTFTGEGRIKWLLVFMAINFFYLAYRALVLGYFTNVTRSIFFSIDYFSFDQKRFKTYAGVKARLFGLCYLIVGFAILFWALSS